MIPQSTALAAPQQSAALSLFSPLEMFELVQKQAEYISKSDMIPKEYRGKPENCAIALEISIRLQSSYFMVMQSLDVIHGRPSWRAQFLIGMVNASGRFGPLQFEMVPEGPEKTIEIRYSEWDNQKKIEKKLNYTYVPTTCRAYATSKITGDMVFGPPVSYDMAIHEGWVAKAGSKWIGPMREYMLTLRAGAFFARIHAPDLTLGMQTAEEIHDSRTIDVESEIVGAAAPTPRAMRDANPYRSAPAEEQPASAPAAAPAAAPAKRERPAVAPTQEAKQEAKQEAAPPASNDGERGIKAYYDSHEIAEGEKNGKPWTKFILHYSVPGGPIKQAATFSKSIAEPIFSLENGDEIRVEIEKASNARFADNLQYLAAVAKPASEGEDDIPY